MGGGESFTVKKEKCYDQNYISYFSIKCYFKYKTNFV